MSLRARLGLAGVCVLLGVLAGAPAALAGPWWRLSSRAAPSYLPAGSNGVLDVAADDLGDVGISGAGSEITLTDVLPAGLKITEAAGVNPHRARVGNRGSAEERTKFWKCTVLEREVTCSTTLAIPPYERLELEIPVTAEASQPQPSELPNQFSVHGGESETGGAIAPASLTRAVAVNNQPVPFGIEAGGYSLDAEEEGGTLDERAGSHPFQLTSTVDFDQTIEEVQEHGAKALLEPGAPALAKDLAFQLPPGLLGDVNAVQQCTGVQFSEIEQGNKCPAAAAAGVATVTVLEPHRAGYITIAVPLFNLQPAQGEPARFGFLAAGVPVVLETSLRTSGDYGVSVAVNDASEAAQVLGAQITFWGDPGSETHDNARGWACLRGGALANKGETCTPPAVHSNTAFLTLPSSCQGPLSSSMQGEAWTGQHIPISIFAFQNALEEPIAHLEGCSQLPFEPAITTQPVQEAQEGHAATPTTAASTPTGLDVNVNLPQQDTTQAGELAQADVASATVTLPEAMQINPSAANGLQGCSETQIGYQGPGGEDPLSPGTREPSHFTDEPAECPQASKIGLVHITTPLLAEELNGAVYLADPAPNGETAKNPFNSLLALYITAENQKLGIHAKLAGEAKLNPTTGQLSTTFANTPQVPFGELSLQLFGGPRGSITTPPKCASYATSATFTPWSGAPAVGVSSEPAFAITTGPGGSPCASPLPLAPTLQAGATNLQAGAFTNFTLQIAHPDGDQPLTGLTVQLPPGVAALLSSVTPCPEPQASRGECGPESEIGQATAVSGLGPDPYTVTGGRVYITGPYQGAPFGLSIATPAVAGPFNLGTVVVRSAINVNPSTAQVTITSSLPTLVQGIGMPPTGIPLQLKQIQVDVERPGFEFNPTNCNPMKIEATLTGSEGASDNVSPPFQVSGCQALPFAPKLSAVAGGHGSKANGTSLAVTVTSGGVNSTGVAQAGIAKVDLALPVALSSRLSTLQKACTPATFNANPASCNEDSVIGNATIHTPVLSNPLSGPAYLVSHGGAAFPDVEFVLQGEGITLLLDGKTDIKAGVTYSRFESAPDAPFTVFETVLPAGPHGVLTPNVPEREQYSLCKASLQMPTEITGQNGTVINQNTPIALAGCVGVLSSKTKLTRAQLLAKALKACRKDKKKRKRLACEKQAHKKYAAKKATAKKATRKTTDTTSHH